MLILINVIYKIICGINFEGLAIRSVRILNNKGVQLSEVSLDVADVAGIMRNTLCHKWECYVVALRV